MTRRLTGTLLALLALVQDRPWIPPARRRPARRPVDPPPPPRSPDPDPDDCQGIPGALARELQALLGVDQFGDPLVLYSCVCRPGAWEWNTGGAEFARRRLRELGYRPSSDPAAPWRVVWAPPGRL